MRSFTFWGKELFQSNLSFLYACSANAALCLKATEKEFSHDTIVPRYFTCFVVGTAVPSRNLSFGAGAEALCKTSVLEEFKDIP